MLEDLTKNPPGNLSTGAYLRLEQMIVMLELKPGSVITERELIERVGMGRTPTREAIQRLSWEGLIEVRPRSGIKIAEIRPDDFVKVTELRAVMEPIFARTATRFASNWHHSSIAECREMMERSAASNDLGLFLGADKSFDTILGDASGNVYLTNCLAPLQSHGRRFWYRYCSDEGVRQPADLHMAVMEAFSANDTSGSEKAMRSLIGHMKARALELLR
ncbi:MAG: GntR family transcriptional regulator [Pseudomonadota bacterium]